MIRRTSFFSLFFFLVVLFLEASLLGHHVVRGEGSVMMKSTSSKFSVDRGSGGLRHLPGSKVGRIGADGRRLVALPLTPHRERLRRRGGGEDDEMYDDGDGDGDGDDRKKEEEERERGYYDRVRRRLDRPAMNVTTTGEGDDDGDEKDDDEDGDPYQLDVDALYQGYGTHYVDLWVGTPPQRQTVIVDTGSSVTAFPCTECTNCGSGYHIDSYFQDDLSATFQEVPCSQCMMGQCGASSPLCQLSVSYQEGSSWKAFEASDLVYTGGSHTEPDDDVEDSFRMRFGCQTHLAGLFRTQLADGIMGMEMSSTAFWYQMHREGGMEESQFSLCFTRQPTASREGTHAGAMTLGGTDPRLHESVMVYADQPNTHGWYTIRLKKVFLRIGGGDRSASNSPNATFEEVEISESDLNNGDVIVDSGTTDTYLSTRLEGPFEDAWKAMTGKAYHHSPMKLSDEELAALPTVLFQIKGWDGPVDPTAPGLVGSLDPDSPQDVLLAMSPAHYMEYSSKEGAYTSRLYFNEGHGGVLGANAMMGHDILFDVENKRVGFAESDCDFESIDDDDDDEEEEDDNEKESEDRI